MPCTVAIHQPQYLPWLPYMAKIVQCDVFVLLDDVQYQKNGMQNRNQIKTAQGPGWLTVPVHADLDASIAQTALAHQPWAAKHLRTIAQSYARARGTADLTAELEPVLTQEWGSLADLNEAVLRILLRAFAVDVPVVRSSTLAAAGQKQDRVLAICTELGATTYLSGRGAAVYQEPAAFEALGISLEYQNYRAPEYAQCHMGMGFVPHMSSVDLALNHPADAASILRNGLLPPSSAAEVHGT
jgi:hypothetical protein